MLEYGFLIYIAEGFSNLILANLMDESSKIQTLEIPYQDRQYNNKYWNKHM